MRLNINNVIATRTGKYEGTKPRMAEGRTMQDDSMDGIGRVESGTETEQLSRATQEQLPSEQSDCGNLPLLALIMRLPRHKNMAHNDTKYLPIGN